MESKKKLSVAFLWHMHQPCYKDSLTGYYFLPWVRLHGVKDYYPMAALMENFEGLRATFNLVPSLVEQIEDYAHNDARDVFLDLTLKRANALTYEDKVQVLENFFRVNFKRFIEPHERYSELLIKKGASPTSSAAGRKIVKSFSTQEFLDLQVLFNLAWFHSISIEEDINLKDLVGQKWDYTEEDKEYVIMKQREILSQIVPLYRRLQESGRIEISATPYYHPITPLLCDTSIARMSSPGIALPKKRYMHPEDANWHIQEAIKEHTSIFGQPPNGMWPSEGSVSDEVLNLMAANGIRWVATDEDILFKSLPMQQAKRYRTVNLFDRSLIYQPYKFKQGSKSVNMVFRDKNLSDIVSFNYNSWDQRAAADDLLAHFKNVAEHVHRTATRGLVTIAMDGENAWEYYEDNGRGFFEALYAGMEDDEDISSTTIHDYLIHEPPRRALDTIFPGSWINHNFEIWIGQEQDNLSWEYLDRTRKDLVRFTKELQRKPENPDQRLQHAWREFYVAEGSDWNWWYGGKAHSGGNNPFDTLYRMHLKNVYKILKKPIPDFLKISIS